MLSDLPSQQHNSPTFKTVAKNALQPTHFRASLVKRRTVMSARSFDGVTKCQIKSQKLIFTFRFLTFKMCFSLSNDKGQNTFWTKNMFNLLHLHQACQNVLVRTCSSELRDLSLDGKNLETERCTIIKMPRTVNKIIFWQIQIET